MNASGASALRNQAADVRVRAARLEDRDAIARMCAALWPDASAVEHGREVLQKIEGRSLSTLPVTIFVAEVAAGGQTAEGQGSQGALDVRPSQDQLIGFIEVGLRSHADGCDESHTVGFLEGWYVIADWRGRGVGHRLVTAAEEWARGHGCVEMASDTWIDNQVSQRAHESIGYEVVGRCVNFRKAL
jgi:aminoglycoside 6'-N-acetyltransferase I